MQQSWADLQKTQQELGVGKVGEQGVGNVQWTNHGYKHVPSKKVSWKDIVKSTKTGDAKYKPEINIEEFERNAWKYGTPVTNGKTWKVFKANGIVGAKKGIETPYIRIEFSANTIHGHPITPAEYAELIK